MLTISDDAISLIITEEDGNEGYYQKHYRHWEWPGGASGPTCGIGYDCGYVTTGEARVDWDGIVNQDTIEAIVRACGLRGELAEAFVRNHKYDVNIAWSEAIVEFRTREIPKWIMRVQKDLPNCELLSQSCLGAIVSLSYNRGCSFDLPGPRFAEMRSIKSHMQTHAFDRIPGDILSMRRLWRPGSDLWRRRGHEADLFKKGLA